MSPLSRTHVNITKKNGVEFAAHRFKRSHLEYWSRQPIPVYAFLVPVIGWPPRYPDRIFGVPITRYVIENGLPQTDTVKLETSECTEFAAIDKDWQLFITEIVPADSAILLLSKGLVSNIEFPNSMALHFAGGLALKHSDKILERIRDAAVILGSETVERKSDDYRGIRHLCEAVVSHFIHNIQHDLGVKFLVESALKDQDTSRANKYISRIEGEIVKRIDIDDKVKSEFLSRIESIKQKIPSI